MNIKFNQSKETFDKQEGWHILTVAESGFSMLSGYASEYRIDEITLREFEERVNHTNQSGSLHPKAPISVVPRKFFRELSDSFDSSVLEEFKTHILDFLTANSKTIKSENLVIDFRVSPSPVPRQLITTTLEALETYKDKLLKNVSIY